MDAQHPLDPQPPQPSPTPYPGDQQQTWGYMPPTAPRRGLPVWAKVLIILTIVGGVGMVLICGGLIYIGSYAPETKAVPGRQLAARYVDQIRDLGLLEPDEQITYFYSDALLDIESGMYFFTDRKVVIYSSGLAPPAITITYDRIQDIVPDFSDSMWVDGLIWLELTDGTDVSFPISAEAGGDERFFDGLVAAWQRHHAAAAVGE